MDERGWSWMEFLPLAWMRAWMANPHLLWGGIRGHPQGGVDGRGWMVRKDACPEFQAAKIYKISGFSAGGNSSQKYSGEGIPPARTDQNRATTRPAPPGTADRYHVRALVMPPGPMAPDALPPAQPAPSHRQRHDAGPRPRITTQRSAPIRTARGLPRMMGATPSPRTARTARTGRNPRHPNRHDAAAPLPRTAGGAYLRQFLCKLSSTR